MGKTKAELLSTKQIHKLLKEMKSAVSTIMQWEDSDHLLEREQALIKESKTTKGKERTILELQAEEMRRLWNSGQVYMAEAKKIFNDKLKQLRKSKSYE